MFDHRGVAPSTPNEGHNGFAGRMQEGQGKFVRPIRSNKQVSGVDERHQPLTQKTRKAALSTRPSLKLRVGRLRRPSPPCLFAKRPKGPQFQRTALARIIILRLVNSVKPSGDP
jgi:hypothetical protein